MNKKKKNFFLKISKAEVILELSKIKNLKFKIPLTYYFDLSSWKKSKKKIISEIKKNFKNKNSIAIRSSSKSEDNIENSSAGKFSSFLNISLKNEKEIIKKINDVIKSYKDQKKKNDQVIIQEMINNVSLSGVVFTKEVDTGLNYYVVNYDDITGKTDTVTSGYGAHSNRTLFIFRNYKKKIKSKRFKKLIECVIDLENKIDNTEIDLEFAITKDLKPYLFQARPISTKKKWRKISINSQEKYLLKAEKKLKNIFKRKKLVLGKKTIFGQMPDWNPVEMIGKHPSNLSYSLYKNLITDKIWAKARSQMGYKDMSKYSLMHQISGQPYIDTRLSLNSFLPKDLPKKIGEKIINLGIEKLRNNPQFHDKIEFEISEPSYAFDTKKNLDKKFGSKLSKKEKKIFLNKLKKLTINFLDENNNSSLTNVKKQIIKLDELFNNYNKKDIKQIPEIISFCKNLGTLNFSILARHGFVAVSFLNSLKTKKIFTEFEIEKFEQSLNTITKKMLIDLSLVENKKISSKEFMVKYGHLRPGSYDINSTRYDQIRNFNFKAQNLKKTSINFKPTKKQHNELNELIKKEGLLNHDSKSFLKYLSDAICLREYSKFIFTKYLSLVLEIIANFGKKKNLQRKDLAYLNINIFLDNKNLKNLSNLHDIIKINKNNYEKNKLIKLPLIIPDVSRTRVIPYQISSPNFITHKKTNGLVILNPDIKKTKNLNKKIVLIENADPGYDWIFGYKISGLVTKYGGINSHMSIRCSELSIPAVIGCGEQIFSNLLEKKEIQIDCSLSIIYSV